jgi:molecular chaperone GrpE
MEEQEKKETEQDIDAENAAQEQLGADGGGEQNEAAEPVSCEPTLDVLQAENAELRDQYLRKAAEFENFRKRMIREKQEAIDFANQNIIIDILPVLDDFERALSAAKNSAKAPTDFDALVEGIAMIETRFISTLENKWNLKRYGEEGSVFDPQLHEALLVEKSPDAEESTVAEVLMKGYMLKDRVIRSAKVKVRMGE